MENVVERQMIQYMQWTYICLYMWI